MLNKPNSCRYSDPEIGVPAMAIVRNKPNFHHSADREIGVPGGESCKTKPISIA
jgi:hypothetical protein